MEKKFSKIEIAVIKRTAQNVNQFVTKKEKIDAKIAELEAEKATLQPIIDSFQGPIKEMTGGFTTEDLVIKETVGTGKIDEKGKEIMQTRYVLKYPETVIPVEASSEAASGDVAQEEIPEELIKEQAEAQAEVDNADPFDNMGAADNDPFNQQ
jgi:hypothetical protein